MSCTEEEWQILKIKESIGKLEKRVCSLEKSIDRFVDDLHESTKFYQKLRMVK